LTDDQALTEYIGRNIRFYWSPSKITASTFYIANCWGRTWKICLHAEKI